jgi:hypothetical protein
VNHLSRRLLWLEHASDQRAADEERSVWPELYRLLPEGWAADVNRELMAGRDHDKKLREIILATPAALRLLEARQTTKARRRRRVWQGASAALALAARSPTER